MKKRALLTLACIVAILLGGVFLLWLTAPKIDERLAKIQNGMTRADVEAILGPPKHQQQLRNFFDVKELSGWNLGGGTLFVGFDKDGKVCDKEYFKPESDSLLQRLRRWLGM